VLGGGIEVAVIHPLTLLIASDITLIIVHVLKLRKREVSFKKCGTNVKDVLSQQHTTPLLAIEMERTTRSLFDYV
jgi:hypothetical protein